MPDLRKNLQVKQKGIQYEPEGNGWPEPLVDESSPLKMKVETGSSGESKTLGLTGSSQDVYSLPEGDFKASPSSSSTESSGGGFKTGQQKQGLHSDPGGR